MSFARDGTGILWDYANAEIERSWESIPVPQSMALHMDAGLIATGDTEGQIYLSNFATEKPFARMDNGGEAVTALAFHPGGNIIASGDPNGTVRLWSVDSGARLQTFRIERPYEQMDITGVIGLSDSQKSMLRAFGAIQDR